MSADPNVSPASSLPPGDAGDDTPMILTPDGETVPLADYLAVPADDAFIVYVDDDGKRRRVKRSAYHRKVEHR